MENIIDQITNFDFNPQTAIASIVVGITQFLLYFAYVYLRGPKQHTIEGRKILSHLKSTPASHWLISPWSYGNGSIYHGPNNSSSVRCAQDGRTSVGEIEINHRLNRLDKRMISKEVKKILTEKNHRFDVEKNVLIDKTLSNI